MRYHIENMTCGGCVKSVTKIVSTLDPKASVDADIDGQSVTIMSDLAPEHFEKILSAAGYPARAA